MLTDVVPTLADRRIPRKISCRLGQDRIIAPDGRFLGFELLPNPYTHVAVGQTLPSASISQLF